MDLNFQYAHNSHDESETLSNKSAEDVLQAFDDFDRSSQVDEANRLQKCSPTLTVLQNGHDEMIWVSGCGESGNIEFVSDCRFPGLVSKWFGLSNKQGTVHLSTGSFTAAQARRAIELFVVKDYDGLRALYA